MGFGLQITPLKKYTMRQAITRSNTLKQVAPQIAEQWNSIRNGELSPNDVTPTSRKKIWWICPKDHEWKELVVSRTQGKECPYCNAFKIIETLKHQDQI